MKLKKLMLLSLSVLLAGCVGNSSTYVIEDTAPYGLAGMTGKKTYNGLIGATITQWNYMGSQEAADSQHFANFVDGLILHNEFGVLERNLAEKVTNNNDKEFQFVIRKDVPWVQVNGKQYVASGEKQYVQASDWVTTAKYICTSSNESPLLNFYMIFIKGAAEYYYWTYINANSKTNPVYKDIVKNGNYAKGAEVIMELIAKDYPTVYETAGYEETPITAEDIPNIDNFSRFGVKANDETRTLTFELFSPAFYFPTVLCYSAFLPTNAAFLENVGAKSFGTRNDRILYCGPYINSSYDDKQIVYTSNPLYWNKKVVHLDKVRYEVIPSTETNAYKYMRDQYESGVIDGFTLDPKDEKGWEKYVTGKDGSGSRENPSDGSVNSRFLNTIGSMYGSNLNLMRYTNNKNDKGEVLSWAVSSDEPNGSTAYSAQIKNTENAFKLADVRRAVLRALDYDVYSIRYSNGVKDKELQSQKLVSTYTPIGFVQDANGNDYVSTHYYEYFAEQRPDLCPNGAGDPENIEEGTAAAYLKPGQYDTRNLTDAQVSDLAVKAVKAVKLYNASQSEDITFPIQIEYWSEWGASDDIQEYDTEAIRSMNKRLNSSAAKAEAGVDEVFKVIPTIGVDATNYDKISGSGNDKGAQFDYSPVLWGWGADYGDPLTYMGTYKKHGDWRDIFKYIDNEYVPNFTTNASGTALEETDLLAEYTEMVDDAMMVTEDINERYDRFAACEYKLLEELAIYVPGTNDGQGWSITVSNSAGYAMPSANYGLAGDRMTGLWVLTKALDRETRAKMREEFQAAKDAYTSSHPSINIYGE